jgi:hypothetical protein
MRCSRIQPANSVLYAWDFVPAIESALSQRILKAELNVVESRIDKAPQPIARNPRPEVIRFV